MNDKGVRGLSAASERRFAQFIEPAAVTLRRALFARNGVEDGCDAAAEAIAWAWEHRADVEAYVEPSVSFDSDLFAALQRLTPDQRTAVVLVHMYGFSYSDASDALDRSEAAVTNHVHRGLRRRPCRW